MDSDVQPNSVANALRTWSALQGIGKKESTQNYHGEIIDFILAHWPGDPSADVATVTRQTLTDLILSVRELSASRFNAIVTALRGALPGANWIKRRKVVLKERHMLTDEEFAALLDLLDAAPRSYGGLVVRFLAQTGMRIGEARRLTWSNVREDRIIVPGAISKNGRQRTIPFIGGVAATLEALRRVATSERVLPQAAIKRALYTACDALGLPRLAHHDFRHLFATRCIQSGVDIPTVARWMGHTDGGALLSRLYFHLVDEHSQQMAARVRIVSDDPATPRLASLPAFVWN